MDIERLIAPSGILSFALFAFSFASGFERLGIDKYHRILSYACLVVVIVHSAAAMMCSIFEPLGILASVGIIFTAVTGFFRILRTHMVIAALTLVISVLHVGFILYMK